MHLRPPPSPPDPELEPLLLPELLPLLLPDGGPLVGGVVLLLHPGVPTAEKPATRIAAAPNESLAKFVMIPFFTFWSVVPAPDGVR